MIAIPGLEAFPLPAPPALLAHLARASVSGGLFVAAVWALTHAVPRMPPALRCGLWWAAGLKLLVALVWVAPFELALLPAPVPEADPAAVVAPAPGAPAETDPGLGMAEAAVPIEAVSSGTAPTPVAAHRLPWRGALVGLWLLGSALGALGLARELRTVRRLRRASRPATDPSLEALFADLRRRLGVRTAVELRLSDRVPGPLTLGLLRPAVVLPERDLARLSREELEMALGHELLHVRRRDLWAGWIPQLARRLFFFHPLAVLAAREYLVAREAACDAAVLRELGAPPRSYGRLLLLWSRRRTVLASLSGIAAAGVSSSFLDLKRRLEMLHEPTPASWRLKAASGALAGLALAALLPLRIVAQPPAPPSPPDLPSASAMPDLPEIPPLPDREPVVVAALPEPPAPPARSHTSSTTWSWSDDDGEAWAFIDGGAKSNVWMSGSSGDARRIDELRAGSDGPLLWFRHDGHEYVVRDAQTLERARAILEPQKQLGRQQGELGGHQGELGAEQGKLGAQQGELGAQQGGLGAQQARLGAQMAALAAEQAQLQARRMAAGRDDDEDFEAEEAAIEKRMEPLEEQMEELGRQQEALGERQEALGRQQEALGAKQEALGDRQEELGRRQEEAARQAQAQLRELTERAIEQGLAERVD